MQVPPVGGRKKHRGERPLDSSHSDGSRARQNVSPEKVKFMLVTPQDSGAKSCRQVTFKSGTASAAVLIYVTMWEERFVLISLSGQTKPPFHGSFSCSLAGSLSLLTLCTKAKSCDLLVPGSPHMRTFISPRVLHAARTHTAHKWERDKATVKKQHERFSLKK